MDHKTVEDYILSMPDAKLDYPFGEDVAVYKVYVPHTSHVDGAQGAREQAPETYLKYGEEASERATKRSATSSAIISGNAGKQGDAVRGEWKMFALIQEKKDPVRVSLKCEPKLAEILRRKYDTVMPGYHLNKKHWNTIVLTGQLSWEEIQDLIKHSYRLVTEQ